MSITVSAVELQTKQATEESHVMVCNMLGELFAATTLICLPEPPNTGLTH